MKIFSLMVVIMVTVLAQERKQNALILGKTMNLHCPVHTKGNNFSIKSITWTKDGKMFYKYNPALSNYAMIIDLDGVEIEDDVFFNGTSIAIGPTTLESAGFYRCIAELHHPYIRGFKIAVYVDTELIVPI